MTDKKQIAIVLYPGLTALDALGPYEVLKMLPGAEIRSSRTSRVRCPLIAAFSR
jgi:putative intracellular protease/amidase